MVCRAALTAAFLLSACGGGGGGGESPPAPPAPPAAVTPAEAVRLAGQAVMDVTELVWALSADVQNTLVTAPSERERSADCPQGGRNSTTRPSATLLRIDYEACRIDGLLFGGRVEAQDALVTLDGAGTHWGGTVRFVAFGVAGNGRSQTVSTTAVGSGRVQGAGQPLALQFSSLQATRTPDALGRGATLSSTLLSVERIPAPSGPIRDLFALLGCVTFTAAGLNAELCIDAGSRIALLENVGTEPLSGRLRWNVGTPGGFDARLRATPGGAPGSTSLRIELDLDGNGSFEAAATLDRVTDIGLRL